MLALRSWSARIEALRKRLAIAEKQDHRAGNRSEAERERQQYDKPLG